MKRVYIASRFRNIPTVRMMKDDLKAFGINAIQTWPDCDLARPHAEAAVADLSEIHQADAVIVVTKDCEAVPGGLWWEVGYAQGQGKSLYIIGPAINVFCEHPDVSRFATWEIFLQEVREKYFDEHPPVAGGCWICHKQPGQPPDGCNGHYLNPGQPAALDELLQRYRHVPVTPEMREEQIRSFAFGNVALSNPSVTRELIDQEADKLGPPGYENATSGSDARPETLNETDRFFINRSEEAASRK